MVYQKRINHLFFNLTNEVIRLNCSRKLYRLIGHNVKSLFFTFLKRFEVSQFVNSIRVACCLTIEIFILCKQL